MAFTVKNWRNTATPVDGAPTPISEASLEDMERRVTDYADSIVPSGGTDPGAVQESMYTAEGVLLSGTSTAGSPIATPLGPGFTFLRSNALTTSGGIDWAYGAGPVVNVKDAAYGAVGGNNPAQNDGPAIQAAINAAAGIGAVYLPQGTYYVNQLLLIPSRTYLFGAGKGRSIIKAAPTFGNEALVLNASGATGNDDITLRDIEFDGNMAARLTLPAFTGEPEARAGLVGLDGRHASAGVGKRIHIRDCALHDSAGLGFTMRYVEDSSVIGCDVWNNERDGISASHRLNHVTIMGNHVRNCGDDHIAVSSGNSSELSLDCMVVGNTVGPHATNHAGHGIMMNGLQNAVCSNNTVRGGHNTGIVLFAAGAEANNIVISNNVLTLPGGSNGFEGQGIRLHAISNAITDVTLSDNIVRTPLTDGIKLVGDGGAGNLRWIHMVDNQIIGTPGSGAGLGHGINLAANAADVWMVNNMIREFFGRGIWHGTNIVRTMVNGGRVENCCKTGGGAAIALGATVEASVIGVRVVDLQGTQTQTAALDYGTSTQTWVANNNFRNCSAADTATGSKSGLEANNVSRSGALYVGDTAVNGTTTFAGNLP